MAFFWVMWRQSHAFRDMIYCAMFMLALCISCIVHSLLSDAIEPIALFNVGGSMFLSGVFVGFAFFLYMQDRVESQEEFPFKND